ncbi:hypothetical protein GF314_07170 [bacterium]|nr:hypothetical protein [bacterium]
MAPEALIPRPDTLQVGWGWFQILLTVTFVLHILFMNALLGGAFVSLLGGMRRSGAGQVAGHDASHRVPTLVALTVNAGVAPLLFLQVLYGHLFYTSSVVMAGWWLAIIPLLIIGYYAAYGVAWGSNRALRPVLATGVVLILAFIGFMFVNNNTMALVPAHWTGWFETSDGSLLNLSEPTIWPRWLHMMIGAVAVGGLFVALIQDNKARRGDAEAAKARDWALPFFTHGSLAQMAVGLWWLMALPDPVMKQFMGGSPFASILLVAGIGLGVWAVVLGFQKKVRLAAGAVVATVLVMALMREVVRFGYLDGVFHPRDLAVEPQLSPLILFLAVFVIGIGCVAYMLRLAARAGKEA